MNSILQELDKKVLIIEKHLKKNCPINATKLQELKSFIVKEIKEYKYYKELRYVSNDSESMTLKAFYSRHGRKARNELIQVYELKQQKFESAEVLNKVFDFFGSNYNSDEFNAYLNNPNYPKPHKHMVINNRYLVKFYLIEKQVKEDLNFIFNYSDIQQVHYPFAKVLSLDIKKPNYNQSSLFQFEQTFKNCLKLEELIIHFQQDEAISLKGLISVLGYCINITRLELNIILDNNDLNEILTLGSDINQLPHLKQFSLKHGYQKDKVNKQAINLFNNCQVFPKLQDLSLDYSSSNIIQLPLLTNDLIKFKNLTKLSLNFRSNSFSTINGSPLRDSLNQLILLKDLTLILEYSQFSDESYQQISDSFNKMSLLETLTFEITHNNLSSQADIYILSNISSCKQLKYLSYITNSNGQIVNQLLEILNDQSQKFNNLQQLHLERALIITNNFQQSKYKSILRKMKRLVSIIYQPYEDFYTHSYLSSFAS